MSPIDRAALDAYNEAHSGACVERFGFVCESPSGRRTYLVQDTERDFYGTFHWSHLARESNGRGTLRVTIAGMRRDLSVVLVEGHSAKDHYFGDVVEAIRNEVDGEDYASERECLEAAEREGYRAVRSGPRFSVALS